MSSIEEKLARKQQYLDRIYATGGTIPTIAAAAKSPDGDVMRSTPVDEMLRVITDHAARLDHVIGILGVRLAPVMRQEDMAKDLGDPPQQVDTRSDLVRSLARHANRLQFLGDTLSATIDRLDV